VIGSIVLYKPLLTTRGQAPWPGNPATQSPEAGITINIIFGSVLAETPDNSHIAGHTDQEAVTRRLGVIPYDAWKKPMS